MWNWLCIKMNHGGSWQVHPVLFKPEGQDSRLRIYSGPQNHPYQAKLVTWLDRQFMSVYMYNIIKIEANIYFCSAAPTWYFYRHPLCLAGQKASSLKQCCRIYYLQCMRYLKASGKNICLCMCVCVCEGGLMFPSRLSLANFALTVQNTDWHNQV